MPKTRTQKGLILFVLKYAYAVLSCSRLFTIGILLSSKDRQMISSLCSLFGYRPEHVVPRIPKIRAEELRTFRQPVQIAEGFAADGNISLLELWTLCGLARWLDPKTILEIGTFDGRTTLNLAINSSSDARIYTIDLPRERANSTSIPILEHEKPYAEKETSGLRYKKMQEQYPEVSKIVQLYGDTADFDFSPYRGSVDMVFVDGSHAYEYVHSDTRLALSLLRNRRGLIVWHDYGRGWEGVTRALNELHSTMPELRLTHIEGTNLVYAVLQ